MLSAGADEPNALVGVARDAARFQPNVRATAQEVFDGLIATSQNRWPSLAFDIGAGNDFVGRFFPAGFYYKTFMWPAAAWKRLYEPVIRAAAGLGMAPKEPDPDRYANRFAHCDLLVVGAGPAGLAAALGAARAGRRVILADENAVPGGSLLATNEALIDGVPGFDWAAAVVAELSSKDNVTVLPRTTAFGYYAQNMVALAERLTDHLARPAPDAPRERLWQVRAGKVVLATGAIERQIVFADNDRPGIMLASAARLYLNHYGVTPGRKIGVYAACDSAWAAAFDLKAAGVEIAAIVDCRAEVPTDLVARANDLAIGVLAGHAVTGTSGRLRVRSMRVAPLAGGGSREFEIDCLLMSGGWTPSVHLFSQSRGGLAYDAANGRFLPGTAAQDCICVGACNGTLTLEDALAEGAAAAGVTPPDAEETASMAGHLLGAASGAGPRDFVKAFVDFQNDVTAKDIRQAVREGMRSIEHVKRYTTNGMATDQGKTANMHGLAIAAETLGKDIPEVGLTTFRPPYTPVTFGAIVNHARGELFDVTRRTPIHGWAEQNGAVFEDVGNWKRTWYFPRPGEDMAAAVNRECRTTRQVAGIFDASTLGKIEVVGPDAVGFMNLLYTNAWDRLDVGRCRYGIMLREDGYIYDDGVVGRLAEDRFHVTTTTGGAPRVLHHMEDYLQTEFPHLKVWLTSVSEQWAVVAVQGPRARDIVAPLIEDVDLAAMPHMSIRQGRCCGVPARIMRVSFTGELGFEINVPADFGRAVWEAVWERGEPLGMVPYGTEAMHVMRAEKGFIIVGQDTDGTVTPDDAGLGWAVGRSKPDFVGIRGLRRPDLAAGGRRQLVGLRTRDPRTVLEEGAQIVADPHQPVPMKMIGFVTSSYWSDNCGHSIALALIDDGRARLGQTLYVPMASETIAVEVTATVFLDPEGKRLDG
ncbi:MAG: sarcosine oxidase subunit alpha [Alphaproteobacteria bacterium]|nr:MAG: sarcosine oxidase subunit alpha [Alphaproteobacteria bacterium]